MWRLWRPLEVKTMKAMREWGRNALVAAALLGMVTRAGVPQQTTTAPSTTTSPSQNPHDPFNTQAQDEKDRVDMPKDMQQRLLEARQTERQKKIVEDTDKLLALAQALHRDVAKTDKNILSLDVIKRADDIEKLAHSVKEHMKG
jgi:hypothetical protein